MEKPPLKLTGVDGNVFVIIAAARDAARRAGWSTQARAELVAELMNAGSYDRVLQLIMNKFEVE